MPSQNRPRKSTTPIPPLNNGEQADDLPRASESHNQQQREDAGDSDGSSNPSDGKDDEFVLVNSAELRKEFQCPICLGIIRKTRTVMECLHRFCRECIDKSMRLGNNECPSCRTHCASRRSLRDDPNYDNLITALYPDIDKYEAEEMALHEEDKNLNIQIQASIAQTFQRQAEAHGKKRTSRGPASSVSDRRHSSRQNWSREKRCHVVEYSESDEEEVINAQSSADEHHAAIKYKRRKKWSRGLASHPSSRTKADDGNNSKSNRESQDSGQLLAWGRAGTRSNNRHGGLAWAGVKFNRSDRIAKLVDYLQSQNEKLMNISLVLVPLKGGWVRSLSRPYISCSLTFTVRQLCQYVEMHAGVSYNVELLIVKGVRAAHHSAIFEVDGTCKLSPSPNELQVLDDDGLTMEEIYGKYFESNLVPAAPLLPQIRAPTR